MGVSGGTCGEEPALTGDGSRDGGQPVGSGRAGGRLLRAEAAAGAKVQRRDAWNLLVGG